MENTVCDTGFEYIENAPELIKLLEDIFTEDFMKANTRFESFEGFRYSSAVIVNWKADTLIYARSLMDSFVRESTNFSSWEELVCAATAARYHG